MCRCYVCEEKFMSKLLRNLLLAAGLVAAGQAAAQVTLFDQPGFHGQSFTADRQVWNLDRFGYNDRASSAVVRGGSWEVCTDARFEGRCVVLRPGDYPSLAGLGLEGNISSVREATQQYGNNGYNNGYSRDSDRRAYRDDNRYEYRNDGWRYDRSENRWE